jgi:hypothetical protein
MSINIIEILRTKSKSELIHLIGSAPKCITNPDLINLIHQYDINNRTKDELLSQQMNMFLYLPGIKDQIEKWLAS